MKKIILSLITLFIFASANAQIQYESPHVKDGKTVEFTLPVGYFEVANGSYVGNEMFASQEGLDFEDENFNDLSIGVMTIIHVPIEGQTLATLKEELTKELIQQNSEILVVGKPEIVKVNGRDCMYAGLKGKIDNAPFGGIYFSAIEFGDYFIVTSYYAAQLLDDLLDYQVFKKIMNSHKEVATTREDEMQDFDEMYYEDDELLGETNYINDLFETAISAYDVLPDFGEYWDIPTDENSHLLSEFVFKEDHGTVKVFSGGSIANYPTDKEKAAAIQLAMDLPTRLSIKQDSEFSNEDHFFQLYTISGGGTMTSVYTTIVHEELVFFVVDGGPNPVPDFKPAVRDFMITMWVDYFEGEEEMPIEED